MVQKQEEKTENFEKLKTFMKGGEKEKVNKEEKKLIIGGGEQKSKQNGEGREAVEPNKRLENAPKLTRMNRKRKPERIFSETKMINRGKFKIIKCADFGI